MPKIPSILLMGVVLMAAIAGGLYFGGMLTPQQGGTVVPGTGGGTATPSYCDPQVTPDVDINAYDSENIGTAVTEATNLYRKVGTVAWTAWTQGTAITGLEIGKEYEFVMGITTSDFTDNAYGSAFKYTAKCQETDSLDKAVTNDEVDTSLTATFYNEDENAAAQTYTAGQIKTVYAKWEAGKDEVYGNPYIVSSGLGDNGAHRAKYPNLLVLALNTSQWDKPVTVRIARSPVQADVGVEMRNIPCPTLVAGDPVATNYCYEAPVISDIETRFAMQLDADNTNAPDADGVASLYTGQLYINSDTGMLEWGNENEDGAKVGSDGADTLALDFT